MKVIFILGSGHCGSTLLDLILDTHSKIFGLGEIENFSATGICGCGETVNNCSFWSVIKSRVDLDYSQIYRKKIDFLLGRNIFYIQSNGIWRQAVNLKELIKKNENILGQIIKESGQEILVDSSKNPDRVELLEESKKIQPIIIHLFRDGRAVSWSYIKKYKKFLPYMWKWFAANIKIEILKRRTGAKYIFIKYEDLAKNPEKIIGIILDSAGLKYEKGMIDFRKGNHHQIGGNRMKLKQERKIVEDNEWRDKMPAKYKIIFNLFFGWLNYYYLTK
jgi:hypothetical protein